MLLGFFLFISQGGKNPQNVELNPSACEDFKDGSDKSEHPFEQLIMSNQCKVINM